MLSAVSHIFQRLATASFLYFWLYGPYRLMYHVIHEKNIFILIFIKMQWPVQKLFDQTRSYICMLFVYRIMYSQSVGIHGATEEVRQDKDH